MAWGNLLLYRLTKDIKARREAIACLDWLIANRSSHSNEFTWGDPYEYATRGGRRPYGQPILIWSALIGQAFLDAYQLLGDEKYLQVAESTGSWILNLPRAHTVSGRCLSYVTYRQSLIHNANVMGAVARLGSLTQNRDALIVAKCDDLHVFSTTCSMVRGTTRRAQISLDR
jgi:hypothetical protein